MDRINSIFKLLSKRTFKIVSIIFFITGDLSICLYIYLKYNDFDYYSKLMRSVLEKMLAPVDEVPLSFIKEQFQIFQKMLIIVIIVYILLHLTVSVFYYLERKYPIKYFYLWAPMGAVIVFSLFISSLSHFEVWQMFFLY